MKPSTLIVWLLIAACIAIDLAVIGQLQVRRDDWPGAGGVLGFGLALTEGGLLAMWLVWGRANVLLRIVSSLLGVFGLAGLVSFSTDRTVTDAGPWFGVLLLYTGLTLLPLAIVRLKNYQLRLTPSDHRPGDGARRAPHQFSIWGLLSLMTAAGIVLSIARFIEFPMGKLVELVLFFTLFALTECAFILSSFLVRRVAITLSIVVVLCPTGGFLANLVDLAPGDHPLALTLTTCIQAVSTFAAVACLRMAGFRLVPAGRVLNDITTSESSDVSESEAEGPSDAL